MTDQNHPTTPSKALEHKWASMFEQHSDMEVFTEVARWGADQELEACLKWMGSFCATWTCGRRPEDVLRAARRPKPPSEADQALALLNDCADRLDGAHENAIRRALELLKELERTFHE